MKLKTRTTFSFIEIRIDEIETTIFKSDQDQIKEMIHNLQDVINDLSEYLEDTK